MKAVAVRGTRDRNGVVSELVDDFVAGSNESSPQVDASGEDLVDANVESCRACGKHPENNLL
jgi:hypothetical protein